MKTLNNEKFMSILHECCKDGKINDEVFNFVLSNYWPYALTFQRDFGEKNRSE